MSYLLIRGGGDLASGVALRLHRSGFRVLIAELPNPLAVRRAVSFSEAVYEKEWQVEGITARLVSSADEIEAVCARNEIPVLIDPDLQLLTISHFPLSAIIDARLIKKSYPILPPDFPFTLGLGPGFVAGENCHAVIETNRGHTLGRVYWTGAASPDTGQPEGDPRRVLRAPCNGFLTGYAKIGEQIESGQLIATIGEAGIRAPFTGVLRGLIRPGVVIPENMKIGDLDPRNDPSYCYLVSDKALAVGGGVLEALLSRSEIITQLAK